MSNEGRNIKIKIPVLKCLKLDFMNMRYKKEKKRIQSESNLKTDISWGHQIRSYVLQPYQLVKDLKTSRKILTPMLF